MKSFILCSIIFLLTINFGWSQSYSWASSNRVDKHLIVHTIQLKKSAKFQSASDDKAAIVPAFVNDIMDELKRSKGVIRITFDCATYTFTILSNDDLVLSEVNKVMEQFNLKMDE
ncbi:MAG: hypothetical protein P8M05_10575 [Flavobacteriales bacterium]|nr:hypothetical protein [Flavobacteriales bacterium]